jgi:poly(3-hydroxybutyrate) depolymerase
MTIHSSLPVGRLACAIAIALTTSMLAADVAPDEPIATGKHSFVFESRGKTIPVFTYRPDGYDGGPLILVLHGMNRNASEYRDRAVAMGDRFKALIAAPEFDARQFPSEDYQRGGITRGGEVMPAEQWTFRFFAEIIEDIRRREGRPDMPCHIVGHSAGGQILTRMAAFQPDGPIIRIIAANPGSLVFPTRDLPFQYGFGGLPEELGGDEAIRRYLAAPLTLFLGTADTGTNNLDQSTTAMRQGPTRIARGRACFAAAKELAESRGWEFNWRIVETEGIGHNSGRLFAHENAGLAIFGPPADN